MGKEAAPKMMEMDAVVRLSQSIAPRWHKPVGFRGVDTEEPDNRKIPLLRLAAFKPKSGSGRWLGMNGISTIEQLMSIQESMVTPGIWSDILDLQKQYSFCRIWDTCVDARSVKSLVEYVLAAWNVFRDPDPTKLYVIATSMWLGNSEGKITCEPVAAELGFTGARARNAVFEKEKTIRKKLFNEEYRRELFEDFCLAINELLEGRNGSISTEFLVAAVNSRFGWVGTTALSLRTLLRELGYKVGNVDDVSGRHATFRFCEQGDSAREDIFRVLIREAMDADSLAYNRVRSAFVARGERELTIDEYNAYADSALKSGKLPAITRKYLKLARSGQGEDATKTRAAIRKVFEDAKREGEMSLTLAEIVERFENYRQRGDGKKAFKSLMGRGGRLDDNESFVFQYQYVDDGKPGKSPTGYALSDYVLTDQVRCGLRNMVADARECLQKTGHRVIGVHGAWKRHQHEMDGLPMIGAFFLARGIKEFSEQLLFHDSKDMRFCLSLPDETVDCNLLAYETWQYFSALGKNCITAGEICSFLRNELQHEWKSPRIPWLKTNAANQYLIEKPNSGIIQGK